MIYIKCTVCNHKQYYTNKDQLMNDLRITPGSKHTIICDACLNKRGHDET